MNASCFSNSRGIPLPRHLLEFALQILSISSRVYLKGLSAASAGVLVVGSGEGAIWEGGWEARTEE